MASKAVFASNIIIGFFGGVQPMAKQMKLATTTVHYWTKQNTIPAKFNAKIEAAIQRRMARLLASASKGEKVQP